MLSPGTRIGGYEVLSPLGAGGMGEVYRARDTRLKREVALKVLPESVAADPERRARFTREAEVLASLNHPNIAALYGFEEGPADAGPATPQPAYALVMELVEGETLADRIARGPIPLDEALPIAKQIAEALEAAHEQAIIHRDLKPANIKLRADGTVKVLDFGLAKLVEPPAAVTTTAAASLSPTITSPALMTHAGMLLGTAAYMSPEQAKGRPADKRSDIWALGCVLFEMLTGKRAFAGDDVADTVASVLRAEPEWDALPTGVSPHLRRVLRQCLARDRAKRIGGVDTVRFALEGELDAPAVVTHAADRHPARRAVVWAAAGLAMMAAATVGALWSPFSPRGGATPALQFNVSPNAGWRLGRAPVTATVSPDGTRVVYLAQSTAGRSALWVRPLASLTAVELSGTDGASGPFWSPDSRHVGFFANGVLKRTAIDGSAPTPIVELDGQFRGATWSRDDVILFASGNNLYKVRAAGGEATQVVSPQSGDSLLSVPFFLPDGKRFLYHALSGVYVGAVDSDARTRVLEPEVLNAQYAEGHLFFARETTLMAQPFDADRLTAVGEPVALAPDIQRINDVAQFSVSNAGVIVYQSGVGANDYQLVWKSRDGTHLGALGGPGRYADVTLSPTGSRVAVTLPASVGMRQIWILDAQRGTPMQLTFDGDNLAPAWSRDETKVAFNRRKDNSFGIYVKAADGAGDETLLLADTRSRIDPLGWTPNDDALLVINGGLGRTELAVLPITGARPDTYLTAPSAGPAQFSPDGRWVARFSREEGRNYVYVTPYPARPGAQWKVSVEGGSHPRWRHDGRELYYVSPTTMLMAASVDGSGPAFRVLGVTELFPMDVVGPRSAYDVALDGSRFLVTSRLESTSSVAELTVVVNWRSLMPPP